MTNRLYRLGRATALHPWKTVLAWLATLVLVVGASTAFGRELEDSFGAPGVDSQEAHDLLAAAGSDTGGLTALLVVTVADPEEDLFTSPKTQAAIATLQARVAALPDVLNITDLSTAMDTGQEKAVLSGAVSGDARVAVLQIQYPPIEELSVAHLDELKLVQSAAQAESDLVVEMGGDLASQFEQGEQGPGEIAGLIVAAIVLLLAFGSIVAAGLPLVMALVGLAIGISSLSLVTYLIDIPAFAPQLAAMIGLGVGIDYALFLVTRHREQLAAGTPVVESIALAVASAGQAVLFAGGTVMIAILGLVVAGIPFMTAAGVATSIVVLVMMIASVTLVPAVLSIVGPRIDAKASRRQNRSATAQGPSPAWQRWGNHVTNNAWAYLIGVTSVLLLMAAPVLALKLGSPDQGSLPVSRTERRAYDLVADAFGPGTNGSLLIVVEDLASNQTEPLLQAIQADAGVESAVVLNNDQTNELTTIVANPTTSPQDSATTETIKRLRAQVMPDALASSDAQAHIGGQTALMGDLSDRIADRLPLFIGAIILLSFVLLTILFRAPVVAAKAAVLNLLSIGAAYGVLVAVFQWGWGASLIGLETTVPIISFIPMFMFAMLFGLSMDYEVFLLSRVREHYLETGDNDSAVIHGISSTARVITSAALIMIAVFGGFVFGDDPTIKMFGLGLATAIAVDATIVRLVLVPASMKLLGSANWWLPGWLDRLLPNVDLDGDRSWS